MNWFKSKTKVCKCKLNRIISGNPSKTGEKRFQCVLCDGAILCRYCQNKAVKLRRVTYGQRTIDVLTCEDHFKRGEIGGYHFVAIASIFTGLN